VFSPAFILDQAVSICRLFPGHHVRSANLISFETCPIVFLLNQKAADFKVFINGDPSPPGQDAADFEHPLPPDYSEEQKPPALLKIEGERESNSSLSTAKPCFRAVQSGCRTSAEDSHEKDWVELLGVRFGADHRNWF
jgi:hypothetical protein